MSRKTNIEVRPWLEGQTLMRKMVILAAMVLLAVGLFPAAAQGSLCRVDLSPVTALLTRAQAAAAAGDEAAALALIDRADDLLAAAENRCDLPVVAVTAELGNEFAGDGFTLRLPQGWSANADATGSLLIGSSPEAANAMAAAEPALGSGQSGMLIAFGTPAQLSGGALRQGDLDALARYYQIVLGGQYLLRGTPGFYVLDGKPAAQMEFSGSNFEGHVVIIESSPGLYAVVAAAAPRAEAGLLLPVTQAVAASIMPSA
jgi:hypothetical protein